VRVLFAVLLLAVSAPTSTAQLVRSFKVVGSDSLVVHIFMPAEGGTNRPSVLLFHGGGFVWGSPEITDPAARDYAAHGFVAFSVQYRLANRSTVTPIEQLEDTFDAIRWVRSHASEFGVDTRRVVAAGASAGGYLVTMAAGSADPLTRPNALVLWSPGVDTGNDPYFNGLLVGRARGSDLSPIKHVRDSMPPTLIISGALDSVTFDSNAKRYCTRLKELNARCDMHSYPNLGHLLSRKLDAPSQQRGEFDWDQTATADASAKTWAFLRSLGYITQ
jgi:acetyl esterase/lipase